ncbi:MAG: glutamate--tRNA ligase [Alphaproteobacteria bacterium]|nr:glutamate--tRNA ligase [Alphaproteobacteria bacterium]
MPAPVTRFAPSPTGYLHIGGARTALFNWLFARHHGGSFRLRIEDTDRQRSTEPAIAAILDGLRWLGLDWDGEVVHQFARAARHAEVAHGLLAAGKAYRCYCSPEELEAMRASAKAEGRPVRYDGTWRDRDPAEAPPGVKPVIRLKSPQDGETVVEDKVQGRVVFDNRQLDDMVLLRSDGTPVYMLSVVVDDYDMAVSHVIRGVDHLNNAARQMQLIQALGWPVPVYAHIPLIHGPDGAKLSKRHGALGVEAYRDMGYLPEALRNYLARLGWSHGDDEIFTTEQAVAWFDLDHCGQSAARFDFAKLEAVNYHYLRQADAARLCDLAGARLEKGLGRKLADFERARLAAAMPGLTERAKTVEELADSALFLVETRPLKFDDKAARLLDQTARDRLMRLSQALWSAQDWSAPALENVVKRFAEVEAIKLGQAAQPLRAALTGRSVSPPIFDVLAALGREESLARLKDATGA